MLLKIIFPIAKYVWLSKVGKKYFTKYLLTIFILLHVNDNKSSINLNYSNKEWMLWSEAKYSVKFIIFNKQNVQTYQLQNVNSSKVIKLTS